MSITKEQQQALDDAFVPREQRLRIGNSNYRLSTTFKPKEPTFQVALEVLSLTPFYQAFLITASGHAIYMHEFWATVTFEKHNIKFNMNKKNYSFDLETFRNMFQICLKVPGHKFVDPPFEEEKLVFMSNLGFPSNIKLLSEVKVEIRPQPWRTFKIIINKYLSGKVTGLDLLRLSQAQIIWGIYHQKNVDYHEVVQKYGAILPDNLTTQAMKESETYKTYYAFATGKAIPKPKYVCRPTKEKTEQAPKASSNKRIKATAKIKLAIERSKTQIHSSQPSGSGAHEGTGVTPGVPDVPTYGSDNEKISWKSSDEEDDDEANINKEDDDIVDDDNVDDVDQEDDNEQTESDNDDDDFVHPKMTTFDKEERQDEEDNKEEGSDLRVQIPSHYESTDDEDSDEETQGANVEGEEMDEEETNKEEEVNELYRDVNVTLERKDTEMTDALCTIIQTTQSSSVSSGFISNMLNPSPDTCIDAIFNLNTESTSLVDVPVTTIAETPLSSATTLPPPSIPLITHLQQTPAPTPYVIESMGAEVLVRLTNQPQTSYVVATSLLELELKKILIDKMDENKSINKSEVQRNLYNALIKLYNSVKDLFASYGDVVTLKRRHDDQDEDKDEEPSAGPNRGYKRRRAEKEPESTCTPKDKTSKPSGKSKEGSKLHNTSTGKSDQAEEPIHADIDLEEPAHQEFDSGVTEDQPIDETTQLPDWFQKPEKPPTPDRNWNKTLHAAHGPVQPWLSTLAQKEDPQYLFEEVYKATTDQLDWNNPEVQQYPHDLRKPLPLIPNSRGRQVIPFDHFINNDLVYLSGGVSSRTYTTLVIKTKAADYRESAHNVYSKRRIIAVTKLQIVKWHNYKHLDWITIRRDDDKLYKFKEGDFKRHRIQDIEDISIVIQRRVEDLQLGVKSYQKKLNLTKLDTYRSYLKRREAYIAYSNPRGFIYQNKDKKNKLIIIDELHNFSDGTLNDVRTALDDLLKGIQMKYMPQAI
ncbi:hypothetical protein Tco_1283788 [Tanacetum coccineum]